MAAPEGAFMTHSCGTSEGAPWYQSHRSLFHRSL